jgi:hypothetical protein
MKFTLDMPLAVRIDTVRGEGADTPFVVAVLAVDGVASVFGVNDFVTVTRKPDADWDPIVCAVQDAAASHLELEHGAPPVSDDVEVARKLLRDAVVPPTPVEIRRGRAPDRDPGGSAR